MKLTNLLSYICVLVLVFVLGSCDKTKPYGIVIPSAAVHFVGDETQSYSVLSEDTPPYGVIIGTTDVSEQDRVVTYSVTSQTGAVQGSQYTLAPKGTITIPAGQSRATINVQGNYTFYEKGEKDTLIFSLSEPGITVAKFLDTVKLILGGPCFDGDVTLSDMSGSYANSSDPDDPKYTAKVTNLVTTSATTGTGVISGLWDGGAPVAISFDWTDPDNIAATIARQNIGFDAAVGMPFSIRTTAGQKSTFSVCNQTITLITDIIIENYFGPGDGAVYKSKYVFKVKR